MPKITAATVAEHHAERRGALLGAAMDILTSQGAAAVTPAAVGARAGLARSSVYQYFPSTADLLATLVEESFARWNGAVAQALGRARSPQGRIEAYIRASLALTATGEHRAAIALIGAHLPEPCRARLAELHEQGYRPLAEAVAEAVTTEPDLTRRLIVGLLQAGMSALEDGAALDAVTERVIALVRGAYEA